MTWTRQDLVLVASVWLGVVAFVVLVCILLPAPPPANDPRFASALLDFFFGAVAVALVSGVAAVFCAYRLLQRLDREIAEREERLRRDLGSRGK
jgi:NhaP-type Na+/H+ or K+/H+ antiporter